MNTPDTTTEPQSDPHMNPVQPGDPGYDPPAEDNPSDPQPTPPEEEPETDTSEE